MKMINVLQRLAELDSQNPNMIQEKPQVSADAAVEAIQKTLSEELSVESLRYLSGVKETLEECGMMPGAPSPAPASFNINASAATGDEVANMLTQIMNLAGVHKVGPEHMPVEKPAAPAPHDDVGGNMHKMLDAMNDTSPEDEGVLGTMAGAGLGALAGGPLGAAVGGVAGDAIGDKLSQEDDAEPDAGEVDIAGVGGALAGAAIHGDADGAAKGMQDGEDESMTGASEDMRKLIDAVSGPEYDSSPADPTDVPQPDSSKFNYDPNQGGTGGDRMDGNMPKGNVTAEDVTAKLFQDYQKFVTENKDTK